VDLQSGFQEIDYHNYDFIFQECPSPNRVSNKEPVLECAHVSLNLLHRITFSHFYLGKEQEMRVDCETCGSYEEQKLPQIRNAFFLAQSSLPQCKNDSCFAFQGVGRELNIF